MSHRPTEQSHEAEAGAEGSLGEQLRRARSARQISLREISDQTRITMRHLEAIESNDYKHLPGGIFNRSFIRAYARAVGFDEKRALDLYARAQHERGENLDEVATSPNRSRVYMDGDVGRSPAVTFGLSALLVGILCLGIYALYYAYNRRFGGTTDGPTPATPTNTQQAASTPAPAPPVPEGQLLVRVSVTGEKGFWVTARQDDGRQTGGIFKPGEPKDFTPERSLVLKVGRANAGDLAVTINGQTARMPLDSATAGDAEWLITKENYKQYLP